MIYSIAPYGRRPNVLPPLAEESKLNGKKAVSFSADTSGSRGVVTTIVVPSGFLGIVVKSNLESGLSYVTRIKDDSPIKEQIRVGDQILEVDGEDVSKLRVIHVASKSVQVF